MANPQPDEFTKISNELYAAIMQTDFSKRQRNMLDLVIRMSYGCCKKSALLRLGDFELVGIHKSDIKSELKTLIKLRVFTYAIEGDFVRIAINKDYEQWLIKPSFNKAKWDLVLKRNLDDEVGKTPTVGKIPTQEFGSEVGKIPTELESGVGKTPTEAVGEIPTNEGDNWQNTNQIVGKIPTETDQKTNDDADYQPPKESKERSLSLISNKGEKKKGVRGKKPEDLRTIEEVISQFTRYHPEQIAVILKYWEIIKKTRATGKIANSVIESNMNYWEKFDTDVVIDSLQLHIMKYSEDESLKPEDYTRGIMRGRAEEKNRKVVSIDGRYPKNRGDTCATNRDFKKIETEYPIGGIG